MARRAIGLEMLNTSRSFFLAALVAMAACAPPKSSATAVPAERSAIPAPPPGAQALPQRNCQELEQDAYAVIAAHSTCTADTDCATAAAACPSGFACGVAVRASDVAQVNADVAPISDRYKAQCSKCARERVRCMKPNPVCREGSCVHEPVQSNCEQLEHEAEALVQEHNSCRSDADCVFARGSGGCPMAFVCGASVNKAEEQAFVALAAPLSSTFYEHCGRCAVQTALCMAATPICSEGRCSSKSAR